MNKIRFIDLFAGIGGMRLAFQTQDTKCVFSSEWGNMILSRARLPIPPYRWYINVLSNISQCQLCNCPYDY